MALQRWAVAGALALTGHAALFAVLPRVRPVAPLPAPGPTPTSAELTVEVDRDAPPRFHDESASSTAPGAGVHGKPTTMRAALAARATGPSVEAGAASAPAPGEPAPAAPESPADDGWSFNPSQAADVTAPKFVASSVRDMASESVRQGAARRAAGGLTDALDQRDASLGLGHGGPVLSALEAASRSMDVPIEGAATFDVAVDSSGRVSVALSNVSSDYVAWTKVASAAGAAVDPSRMHLPAGVGWHVVVQLDAHVQYPDGRRPSELGTRVTTSTLKLSKTSMVVESVPGFTIATQGKICGVGLNVQLSASPINLMGGCSPENAGMPANRIVSGHIVSEGRL